MKYLKYIVALTLFIGAGFGFTGCDDDENLGDPPRLFRPIVSLENSNNNLTAKWDNIAGANYYDMQLYRVTGTDEAGENILELYCDTVVEKSPVTFKSIEWDEKYLVKIKAIGTGIESNVYTSDDLSILYITKLSSSRTIDVAALVTWKTTGDAFDSFVLIPQDNEEAEPVEIVFPEDQHKKDSVFAIGEMIVNGLLPNTTYRLIAYIGEGQNNDTYAGRMTFTTREGEDFDAKYGAGKWYDLRGKAESDDILISDAMTDIYANYDVIILEGGYEYKMTNGKPFLKSVHFVTGMSLAGNAKFVQSGGMGIKADVDHLKFENIDFISDKAYATPISETTDKGFGGRQVYNVNNVGFALENITFIGCRFEGYRALVRSQADSDVIKNVTFEDCVINGVGDQAAVTTTNKTGTMDNVTFRNCTITNVVMLADLRLSKNAPNFTITDCTFCYVPIEPAGNGILRLGSNNVSLTISNTIFGPAMATKDAAGSLLETYNAGTTAVNFINMTGGSANVSNSYALTYEWTNLLDGITTIPFAHDKFFQKPNAEDENYTIIQNFDGAKTAGAIKWRMP